MQVDHKELIQCSRCHSTKLTQYFGINTKGDIFKTCSNCRRITKRYNDTHRNKKRNFNITEQPLD